MPSVWYPPPDDCWYKSRLKSVQVICTAHRDADEHSIMHLPVEDGTLIDQRLSIRTAGSSLTNNATLHKQENSLWMRWSETIVTYCERSLSPLHLKREGSARWAYRRTNDNKKKTLICNGTPILTCHQRPQSSAIILRQIGRAETTTQWNELQIWDYNVATNRSTRNDESMKWTANRSAVRHRVSSISPIGYDRTLVTQMSGLHRMQAINVRKVADAEDSPR